MGSHSPLLFPKLLNDEPSSTPPQALARSGSSHFVPPSRDQVTGFRNHARMDPSTIVTELGGVATRQQLVSHGCTGFDLTVAVRSGLIRRVRQARYTNATATADAVAAARVGGMLAGPSAARSYGLWSGFDTRLHVSVGDNSARLRTNRRPSSKPLLLTPDLFDRRLVLHWLKGGAVPERGPECWRVSVSTCLRQMVAWCDRETAIACLDTAITKFSLSVADVAVVLADQPDSHRVIAAGCAVGSDSGVESVVRQRLLGVDVRVEQQFKIPGVGRFDMRVVGTKILIEVDGREFHDSAEQFERDRWRNAEATRRGFTVIQLSYLRVFGDWGWCQRTVLDAIAISSFRSLSNP